MALTFISDDGHGWLRVTSEDLASVGLTPLSFSRYSYRDRSGNFYLEEDSDVPKFLAAHSVRRGVPEITEAYERGQCFIRNLPPIHDGAPMFTP